jgi:hypothetical protein
MHPVMLGVALSLMGVKTGWVPAQSGGTCYIIQLDSHEVDVFRREQRIESPVRSELQDVREFRIVMGSSDPPQQPPLDELLRTFARAKSEKQTAGKAGSPRGDPYGQRWSPESLRNALDTAPPSAPVAKKPLESMKTPGEAAKKPITTPPSPFRPFMTGSYLPTSARPPASGPKSESKETEPKKTDSATGLALALLGSLGGNCYLAWIVWESRLRCRALLRRRHGGESLDSGESGAVG